MKNIFLIFCLSATSLQAMLPAGGMGQSMGQGQGPSLFEQEQDLVINNRVLVRINAKPITVMDVVRKMDLFFYRQYPELATSPVARYQFYGSAWETMLTALIDDYLIVADAEEKGVVISEGEIREELENLFGPDVVFNLDGMGLSLAEATEMLKMELTVQRMNMMMVRARAMTDVKPKEVRARYEQMLKDNPPQNSWVYRVLSIRGDEHERVAQEASKLLNEQKLPFEEIVATLSTPDIEISVSDDYQREEGSISLGHMAVLQTLSAGAYSAPLSKDSVSRIFCLGDYQEGESTPFNDIAEKIRSEIVQEVSGKFNEEYRMKLRVHYGMTDQYLSEVVPEGYAPFALR